MEERTLQTIQSKFPGSSWALWSEDFPAEGCIEEDADRLTDFIYGNRDNLNSSVVLLSLNPSATMPSVYQNFHSPASKHYDTRLKEFIQDNDLENISGAYMTDIAPDIVEPDSNNVTPADADTDRFIDQLHALGHSEYDIISFSKQAFEALRSRVTAESTTRAHNIQSFTGSTPDHTITVYRVWHYSNYGANADKIPELEQQLRYLNDEALS